MQRIHSEGQRLAEEYSRGYPVGSRVLPPVYRDCRGRAYASEPAPRSDGTVARKREAAEQLGVPYALLPSAQVDGGLDRCGAGRLKLFNIYFRVGRRLQGFGPSCWGLLKVHSITGIRKLRRFWAGSFHASNCFRYCGIFNRAARRHEKRALKPAISGDAEIGPQEVPDPGPSRVCSRWNGEKLS
jgi:hypothetical protein